MNAIIANAHDPSRVLSLWDVFLGSHIGHIADIRTAVRDVLLGVAKKPYKKDTIH